MHKVSGKFLIDDWGGESGPATVYVRLLDTSWIDAKAITVDEIVLNDVMLDQIQKEGMRFTLAVQDLDPLARYEVSVLVDLDGDGETSVGDYRNTISYPVLTRGFPSEVEIRVQYIG